MKLSELFNEGNVIPFKKSLKPTKNPEHTPNPEPEYEASFWDKVLKDDPDFKPNMPGNKNQEEIDRLVHRYVNLGVGSQILYNNRLAQIIKMPDSHRLIISFDDNGEKKIVGKKDRAIDLIPEEHL